MPYSQKVIESRYCNTVIASPGLNFPALHKPGDKSPEVKAYAVATLKRVK